MTKDVCAHACELPCMQVTVTGCSLLLSLAVLGYILLQTRPVYLIDFHIYRPPDRCGHHLCFLVIHLH